VAWLFGYPAIPAFDFFYGGGISFYMEREPLAVLALYALFALLLHYLRERPRARTVLFSLVLLYTLAAWTPLHRALGVFMGHGAELVVAGVFFFRALSGYGCFLQLERPLYAICAWFIELSAIHLAYGLITSEQRRQEYAAAKGGGHLMDFDVLARDYLGVDVSVIAVVFLLLSLLPLFLSYLYLINRGHVRALLARVVEPRSES
jgi:hypothetical protein